MITLHPLSSGSGIDYLLSSVAGDDVKVGVKDLAAHWAHGGDTPGEWLGVQAEAMGLTGRVTQEAADAVFKDAVDPVSGQKMGRAWPRYTPAEDLYAQYLESEPEASEARRQQLRAKADREGNRTARAGWEMVFSPVKSFSVLWATADDEQRRRLEKVEREAFEKVFDRIEKEACWTRVGPTAAAQVQVAGRGFIGASFTHRSSRAGDPDFHRHLSVSAKVRTEDGRWLALDARPLHALVVEFSEQYTAEVERGMAAEFGVLAEVRQNTVRPSRRPVREFLGVDGEMVGHFSERRRSTEGALASLTRDFMAREGREPSRAESYKLAQSAALTARPDKRATTVEQERRAWRRRARQQGKRRPDKWIQHAREASRQAVLDAADTDVRLSDVADRALEVLEGQRAHWTRSNAAAEVYRQLVASGWHVRLDDASFDSTVRRVTDAVLDPRRCVRLDAPDTVALPERFQRADGTSLFEPVVTGRLFTSHSLLAAEQELVEGATRPAPVRVLSAEDVDEALAAADAERGFVPSEEQRRVVRNLLGSDVRISAVIGPAGTGKTTIMRLVREAAEAHGLPVLGLAGGQVQADNLAEEAGIRAENIARWRYMSERQGGPQWSPAPGQIVIVDEAGQASTPDLLALSRQVESAGGRLLLVGDPRQLGSPGVGGALELVEADAGAQYLTEVRRFRDADKRIRGWEVEAAAALSRGEAEASFDAYAQRGRIVHGGASHMIDALYEAWRRDRDDGLSAIMIASNNGLVAQLNARARDDLIARGEVDTAAEAALADGNRAGAGDRVVTRANDRRLRTHDGRQWVRNGDTWTVEAVEEDGAVTARHDRTGRLITLPADYVGAGVELGYAITKDRAQGVTVDAGHALFDASLDRNGAYPALTRGRYTNHAYLVTAQDADLETGEPGAQLTARQVWQSVLRRDGSQHSATVVARRMRDEARSVRTHTSRLAYVLDQIADDRTRHAVAAVLGERAAEQLTSAPAWPALRIQLGRLADAGFDTDRLLEATWNARGFVDENGVPVRDIAAVVHARNARAVDEDEGRPQEYRRADDAPRPATAPELVAVPQVRGDDVLAALGLVVPEPEPHDDRETLAAARELAAAARSRAAQLAESAVLDAEAGAGWAAFYGPEPGEADAAAAWRQQITAAALYRDVAGHDGAEPTGPAPAAGGDGARLRALWRAAQDLPDPAVRASELAGEGPAWLDVLGVRPTADDPARSLWDDAAAAVSAYRELWEFGHETVALGERPADPVSAADYDLAHTAIAAWRAGSGPRERVAVLDEQALGRADHAGRSAADRARRVGDALTELHRAEQARDAAEQVARDARNRAEVLRQVAQEPEQLERLRQLVQRADEAEAEALREGRSADEARQVLVALAPQALADRERERRGGDARRELARRARRGTAEGQSQAQEAAESAEIAAWHLRPHGRLSDRQLRDAHRRALDAARAADGSASSLEERAAELDSAAAPGGRIERSVRALADQAAAIHRLRAARERGEEAVREMVGNASRREEIAARLAATRLGVPVVRGSERRELEGMLEQLGQRAARLQAEIALAERQRDDAAVTAGAPGGHRRALEEWERAGGTLPAALAAARDSAVRGSALAERDARSMRDRSRELREEAAALRREMSVRAVLPDERRAAERQERQRAARGYVPGPEQGIAPQRPPAPRREGPGQSR
ncbi:relaxase domain-containing protein [Streptomyces sp. ISL-22]|uniref:MobF family relaxase n=1 Tax=unclassified Streptomyces TaxID=2593676 RepID=UPI001BEB2D47|nr:MULTISPECIES: MobF family relaxase [unclassified Streptomyces]MBT2418007.1 relaxase domain-containing protein [Streptomyces sp. ISL-24]MBT2432318.1 relaxase domain-containing protein [Streptomyces sp. ISL-22]